MCFVVVVHYLFQTNESDRVRTGFTNQHTNFNQLFEVFLHTLFFTGPALPRVPFISSAPSISNITNTTALKTTSNTLSATLKRPLEVDAGTGAGETPLSAFSIIGPPVAASSVCNTLYI